MEIRKALLSGKKKGSKFLLRVQNQHLIHTEGGRNGISDGMLQNCVRKFNKRKGHMK